MSSPSPPPLHSPFSQVVEQLTGWEAPLEDSTWGHRLTVDALKVTMPIELSIDVDNTGAVTVNGSAPTQTVETTIMPVFHRVRMRLTVDEEATP